METDTSLNCCICYKMSDKRKYVVTSCNHYFCTDCFFKWLLEKPSCPLCRKIFTKPHEQELLEELDHLYTEIEEYSNYRSLLARNIIIDEKKFKNLKNNNIELQTINTRIELTNNTLQTINDTLQTTNKTLQTTNDTLKTTNNSLKTTQSHPMQSILSNEKNYKINNQISYNLINQRSRNMFSLF
jgi:hypothetical protein